MAEKLIYSPNICGSGILISYTGLNLSLDETYRITFTSLGSIPTQTNVTIDPTGYLLRSQKPSPELKTFVKINSNMSDNSSNNIIALSIYDSNDTLIYTDYKNLVCGTLCGSGYPIPASPTPTPSVTITPTLTPTPTITPTVTASPPAPPLAFSASFDRYINTLGDCNKVTIRGKAQGVIGETYRYKFNTDMNGLDLKLSNPSGVITILDNPTYVYTEITLPNSCQNYILEFGLSDANQTVQSMAVFRCGNC